jgi:hypothetical protein
MGILNEIRHNPTYERKSAYSPVSVVSHIPTNATPITSDRFKEGYRAELTVRVNYWSNPAQLQYAQKSAEEQLRMYLYSDLTPLMYELRSMLMTGDTPKSMITLDKMMDLIRGKTFVTR